MGSKLKYSEGCRKLVNNIFYRNKSKYFENIFKKIISRVITVPTQIPKTTKVVPLNLIKFNSSLCNHKITNEITLSLSAPKGKTFVITIRICRWNI